MQYVIIGNSTAATFAVEGIRAQDKRGKIVILSDEARPAYGRPLISYYLYGRIALENTAYRPASFYEENAVEVRLNTRAAAVDAENKRVLLADGSFVPYDKLLVATGSRPFIPPTAGYESVERKFTFMTMDDALALERELSPDRRVLVVGAGLIGLKCVEGILDRVRSVTVVDMADRILSSILDEEGAALVRRQLEEKGVRFVLGDRVAEYAGNTARLAGGAEIAFDVLVTAVGVRPNVGLVKEAGGAVGRGIVVDDRQRTSLPDVYAAGDNCESVDVCTGARRILAILPNAALQGGTSGTNMAGGDAVFAQGAAFNAIGFFGSHIATAGVYEGESFTERGENSYKKLFWKDNALKGFIIIGDIDRAGIYTSLIREQTPLDTVDFELLKRHPALMAFAGTARAEKLARRQ